MTSLDHTPPLSAERLAEIRRNEAEVADYIADGLMRSTSAYRDRSDLLAEVDRLNKAVDLLGMELQKGSTEVMDALREAAAELRDETQQEMNRLRAALQEIAQRTVQRDLNRLARTALGEEVSG